MATQGRTWKEQRKFTHGVLRDFGMGRPLIEEKIQEELTYFLKELQDKSEGPMDPHQLLQISISNIICSVVFGKRYEYTNPTFMKYMECLDENFKVYIHVQK